VALRTALPGLTQRFTGPGRSYEDLVNAASAVTRFLQRELGYYLGYAYLPEQVPVNGVIRIAVLEGRLDEVILNWPAEMPVDRAVVEAYLARLVPGEILRVRDVERIVFLVNDLRGLTARFEVKAGRTPGTASLVVTAQAEERFSSRVEVDSYGSRYSGVWTRERAGDGREPRRARRRGGAQRAVVVHARHRVRAGRLHAAGRLRWPQGGLSGSYVRYKLDEDLLDGVNLSGDATTITAYGLYPVIRSRNLNLFGLASIDLKSFNDKQFGTSFKKKTTDLTLSLSGDARDDLLTGGVNTFEVIALHGKLDAEQQGGLNANPSSFTVARVYGSRLQNVLNNRLLAAGELPCPVRFRQPRQHGAVPARRSRSRARLRSRRGHGRHRSGRLARAALLAAGGVVRADLARARLLRLLRRSARSSSGTSRPTRTSSRTPSPTARR
jgi:hemolysin activation/secretion protein